MRRSKFTEEQIVAIQREQEAGAVRYRSRRPDDAALRVRMRALAAERRRFGYRLLHVLLRHGGWWKTASAPRGSIARRG